MAMISQKEELLIVVEPSEQNSQTGNGVNVGTPERAASVIAGAVLISLGVKYRTWAGLLSAAAGIYLVTRGTTGRCSLYQGLDINTAQQGSENFIRGKL